MTPYERAHQLVLDFRRGIIDTHADLEECIGSAIAAAVEDATRSSEARAQALTEQRDRARDVAVALGDEVARLRAAGAGVLDQHDDCCGWCDDLRAALTGVIEPDGEPATVEQLAAFYHSLPRTDDIDKGPTGEPSREGVDEHARKGPKSGHFVNESTVDDRPICSREMLAAEPTGEPSER